MVAEIYSRDDGGSNSIYHFGYWLRKIPDNEMTRNPEYVHHTKVDGSDQYGGAVNCFPRRCVVGGSFHYNADFQMQYGSRTLICRANTAWTDNTYS